MKETISNIIDTIISYIFAIAFVIVFISLIIELSIWILASDTVVVTVGNDTYICTNEYLNKDTYVKVNNIPCYMKEKKQHSAK